MVNKFSPGLLVRIASLFLVVIFSPHIYNDMHAEFDRDTLTVSFELAIFLLAIGMVVFVISLQAIGDSRESKWKLPSWDSSLYQRNQPANSAHFASWVVMTLGASVALYSTVQVGRPSNLAYFLFTLGVGWYIGMRISILLFRRRFKAHDDKS
jgi:hypothetical protein